MLAYTIRRLLQGILLIIAVSILVFSMLHLMPGDPVELITDRKVPPDVKAEMKRQFGLDLPLYQQYLRWVKNIFRGDFGISIRSKTPVASTFRHRIPVTLKLTGTALLVEFLVGVPLGLWAAYKKDSRFDRAVISTSLLFAALPSFWVAVMLIMIFGVHLKLLPLSGFSSAKHYVLPVLSIALGGIAGMLRMTKSEVLDVLNERFVFTAYAKGLDKRTVLVKHVLYNSIILILVMMFLSLPWIISGAVIIENIFVIPGMGGLLTQAIINQDMFVVQGCVLIISILTVLSNILADLLIAALDPRIRVSMSGGGN
ncbi:MAG TPA: ABC transporter permease [Tissierellia bacterium]|nr:ABC transporter permease [Tissierellia bacterium]